MTGKSCFVIAPIGGPDTDIRNHSDKLLEFIVEPAVESQNYEATRADKISEPGMITSQVIEHVVDSELVIADLTNSNANVFYELAIRHAAEKPIIQLISDEESIPFDVAGTRTIKFNFDDIDSIKSAKSEIQDQIDNIESKDATVETPISTTLNLMNLRESQDPEERSMADMMENISELRSALHSVQENIEDPERLLPPEYLQEITRHLTIKRNRELLVTTEETLDVSHHLLRKLENDENSSPNEIQHLKEKLDSLEENMNYSKHPRQSRLTPTKVEDF